MDVKIIDISMKTNSMLGGYRSCQYIYHTTARSCTRLHASPTKSYMKISKIILIHLMKIGTGSTLSIRRVCVVWRNMLILIMLGIRLIERKRMALLLGLISFMVNKRQDLLLFNNWGKVCSRCRVVCSTLVDEIVDVFRLTNWSWR